MHLNTKALWAAAAVAALLLPSIAVAQKTVGGVIGIERTRPGTWRPINNNSMHATGTQNYYRGRSSNVVVRSQPGPNYVVAEAPNGDRTYSYEPSQQASGYVTSNDCCCPPVTRTERSQQRHQAPPQPPTEPQQTASDNRSFSYEPQADENVNQNETNAVRTSSSNSGVSARPHATGYLAT